MKNASKSLILILISLLSYSQSDAQQSVLKNSYQSKEVAPVDVSFLQFNIWQEGTSVENGLEKIKNIIVEVNPDVVSFVEVRNYNNEDWTTKIVNALADAGLSYNRGYLSGADVSIISKYPIVSTGPLVRSTSFFEIDANGVHFFVAPSHLDYKYYACYLPRGYNCDGSSPYTGWSMIDNNSDGVPDPVTDINTIINQNLGSQRDEQIAAFIAEADKKTLPVIIIGDFNEPSCLDWTNEQANMFDHNGVVYEWSTTKSLKDNGYIDCFREAFPNIVDNPGFTWPAVATGKGSTSWAPKSDERDRIDFIFYKGDDITVKSAAIVGPKEAYVRNVASDANSENETFLAEDLPWPSDHKGVYAVVNIPYTSPDYIKLSTTEIPEGSPVNLIYKIEQFQAGDKLAVFNDGDGPNGTSIAEKVITADSASVVFKESLTVGNYEIYLLNPDGDIVVDAVDFSVVGISADAIVSDSISFELGKPYSFKYNSVNFTTKDWIGIYPASRDVVSGGNPGISSDWVYIPNANGSVNMLNENYTITETGEYKAYLFSNDSYNIIAGPSYFYLTNNTTRIGKIRSDIEFNIYPNPATDDVTIFSKDNNLILALSIYSLTGQKMYQQDFGVGVTNKTIITDELSEGVWLLQIRTSKGNSTRKITIR